MTFAGVTFSKSFYTLIQSLTHPVRKIDNDFYQHAPLFALPHIHASSVDTLSKDITPTDLRL